MEFDPAVISYEALTAHFLRTIDVTDGGGQFCDRGESYIPALFPIGPEQAGAATRALDAAAKELKTTLAVKLGSNPSFVAAEDYHQNYYLGENRVFTRFGLIKQSEAYKRYRKGCGRDERVKQVWGDAAFTFPWARERLVSGDRRGQRSHLHRAAARVPQPSSQPPTVSPARCGTAHHRG